MNPQHKFNKREQIQQQMQGKELSRQPIEFDTVEKMLRHDAMHTPVPPAVGERLRNSLGQVPESRPQPWWRRWLGK